MATFSATARVQVTIEIDAGSSWGPDCTVAQIQQQAGEEATRRLVDLVAAARVKANIVGTPKVTTIIHGAKPGFLS